MFFGKIKKRTILRNKDSTVLKVWKGAEASLKMADMIKYFNNQLG